MNTISEDILLWAGIVTFLSLSSFMWVVIYMLLTGQMELH